MTMFDWWFKWFQNPNDMPLCSTITYEDLCRMIRLRNDRWQGCRIAFGWSARHFAEIVVLLGSCMLNKFPYSCWTTWIPINVLMPLECPPWTEFSIDLWLTTRSQLSIRSRIRPANYPKISYRICNLVTIANLCKTSGYSKLPVKFLIRISRRNLVCELECWHRLRGRHPYHSGGSKIDLNTNPSLLEPLFLSSHFNNSTLEPSPSPTNNNFTHPAGLGSINNYTGHLHASIRSVMPSATDTPPKMHIFYQPSGVAAMDNVNIPVVATTINCWLTTSRPHPCLGATKCPPVN